MKTGIITTDSYSNHETGQGHPERADRVSVVIENLEKNKKLIWKKPLKFDPKYLKITHKPNYIDEITISKNPEVDSSEGNDGEKDELYHKAVEIIKMEGKASTSFLQRKLQIGYNRAARIMETMEKEGIVGQPNHVGKREIL